MAAHDHLIDTSAFLRFFIEDDSLREPVAKSVAEVYAQGGTVFFTPQVVREAWSVLTRPRDVGGYSRTPDEAFEFIEVANTGLSFLADTPKIHPIWLDLVKTHRVSGRQVHDAYHVAAMMAHGITHILTIDARDFQRYQNVTIVRPSIP